MLIRGSKTLENFKDLPNFTFAVEKWFAVGKFEENASDGPDVNTCAVDLRAEKHLWSSVPKCDNFMGKTFKWKTE